MAPQGAKGVTMGSEMTKVVTNFGRFFMWDYAAIYKHQPAVRTVTGYLARNVAMLNLKAYLRVGDDDRKELDGAPIAEMMRNPNPLTSRYRFFRDLVMDICLYDHAYWVKDKYPYPTTVTRLPPSTPNNSACATTTRRTASSIRATGS